MSEIIFEELELQNFGSIGQATLPLENRGLLLIQGRNEDDPSANSNGAGKSSLVDGIAWTLFGVTARGVSGDAVVNRTAGKGCIGRVAFRDGADQYVVTRHRKHKTGKNRLVLLHNGNDITKGTDKLTQDALEKILGCTLDVFLAAIYAGQEQLPNLPAMTDKELKMLVEEASGVKVLETAYEVARKYVGEANATLLAATALVNEHDRSVLTTEAELAAANERGGQWEEQRKTNIARMRALIRSDVDQIKVIKAGLAGMDPAVIRNVIDDIQAKILAAGSLPPAPTAPVAPVMPLLPAKPPVPVLPAGHRDRVRALDRATDDLARLETDMNALTHELAHLGDKVGTPCGECGKHYVEEDLALRKTVALKRREELALVLDAVKTEAKKLQGAIETLNGDHAAAIKVWEAACLRQSDMHEQACATLREQHAIALAAHEQALRAHAALRARRDTTALLQELRDVQSDLDRVAKQEAQLRVLLAHANGIKEEMTRAAADVNPWVVEAARRAKTLETAVGHKASALATQQAQASWLLTCQQAAEVFAPNGVRGEILDAVTPFLNDRTNAYLGALSDGSITAQWSTIGETGKGEVREKFHIAVNNVNGADSFEGQSGGERRKVRIATAMALQDLVASRAYKPIKLFAADEIDDALDVSGLERLMGILEDKGRAVGTVLLVSHNDLADWARAQVTVIKKDGVSKLEAC